MWSQLLRKRQILPGPMYWTYGSSLVGIRFFKALYYELGKQKGPIFSHAVHESPLCVRANIFKGWVQSLFFLLCTKVQRTHCYAWVSYLFNQRTWIVSRGSKTDAHADGNWYFLQKKKKYFLNLSLLVSSRNWMAGSSTDPSFIEIFDLNFLKIPWNFLKDLGTLWSLAALV